MAGVFLSYDRDDTERARQFASALEKSGHSVWWDLHVRGGAQFSKAIEQALQAADAVVVLWSANSVESAWVRDEAAAGRDSGRLIPVTIDGTKPPLGFRQFQTIDLRGWKGRGSPQALKVLLADIAAMEREPTGAGGAVEQSSNAVEKSRRAPARAILIAGAILSLAIIGVAGWLWSKRSQLPLVEVAAADSSRESQAVASDLFVKLGSLAQVGSGKWQLVDAASAPRNVDLIFRAADAGSGSRPDPSLVLLDGHDNSVLWSRDFGASENGASDLRQRLALTAGRVLGCALEARVNGGLRRDLFKLFLNGCAQLAEASQNNPETAASSMRTVITGAPKFAPAWGRLLTAEMNILSLALGSDDETAARGQLRQDTQQATKVAPDLPEITISNMYLLPWTAYAQALELLSKAKAQQPEKPEVYGEEATALMRVGRMGDAIVSARRAAELDPLSPAAESQLILTLAHGGQVEEARNELARAEKVWAGTGALSDAEFSFNVRYGNAPDVVKLHQGDGGDLHIYAQARENPSPENVQKLIEWFKPYEARHDLSVAGSAVQALGQFHQTDAVFRWLAMVPTETLAEAGYVLFRPYMADIRNDARFMAVAKRIGLIDYWQKTGKWPDYCSDPRLPYDCKKEAAKYR